MSRCINVLMHQIDSIKASMSHRNNFVSSMCQFNKLSLLINASISQIQCTYLSIRQSIVYQCIDVSETSESIKQLIKEYVMKQYINVTMYLSVTHRKRNVFTYVNVSKQNVSKVKI